MLPEVDFNLLSFKCTQKLSEFSLPQQILLADFALLLGLALLNLVALVLWPAQPIFLFKECLYYLLESLCTVI